VRPDRVLRPTGSRQQQARKKADYEAAEEPDAEILQNEPPPHEVSMAGGQSHAQRDDGRQGKPVVEPGLEVQRMPDDARHPRIRHDPGGEHRIRRGEQRPEQERLDPGELQQGPGGDRDDHGRDRHSDHQLAQRQVPRPAEHLPFDLEPVAKQDHDQRGGRKDLDETRSGRETEDAQPAAAEREPDEDEQRRQSQERAARHRRSTRRRSAMRRTGPTPSRSRSPPQDSQKAWPGR